MTEVRETITETGNGQIREEKAALSQSPENGWRSYGLQRRWEGERRGGLQRRETVKAVCLAPFGHTLC